MNKRLVKTAGAVALLAVMLAFCLIPFHTSDLILRLHVIESEYSLDDSVFKLYYALNEAPGVFGEDRYVEGVSDDHDHTVDFRLESGLKGKLGALRVDFQERSQTLTVDGFSVISAGMTVKQINPLDLFDENNISAKSDIEFIQSIEPKSRVIIKTGAKDPYIVFSEELSSVVTRHFSSYTLTKLFFCFFILACILIYRHPLLTRSADMKSASADDTDQKELPLLYVAFGLLLAYISYRWSMADISIPLSDTNGHTYVYLPLFFRKSTLGQGFGAVPYCMWEMLVLFGYKGLKIPLANASAYANSLFAVFSYCVICFGFSGIMKRSGRRNCSLPISVLSFGICILEPLSAEWMNVAGRGPWTFSPNPLYSPSFLAVRGFSVLCFMLVLDIWGAQRDSGYKGTFFKVETGLRKYYILLAVLLVLSVLAKPTFAEMFIPAVGLFMLARLVSEACRKDGSGKKYAVHLFNMFMCAVPSILIVLGQIIIFYVLRGNYGGSASPTLTPFLEVWRMFVDNPGLSIIPTLAFPMFVMMADSKDFFGRDSGKLVAICLAVGFIEAAFLGEEGKMGHGNFMWPMMSAMFLAFFSATAALIRIGSDAKESAGKRLICLAAMILLGTHVLCGILNITSHLQVPQ